MGFPKKTITDVPVAEKTVLVRTDYNVPLTPDGEIHDDYRIRQSIPTIKYLLEQNCKIVLCSHLGRPDGQTVPKFSLEPIALRLQDLLGQPVIFLHQSVGDNVIQTIKRSAKGTVILLENLRFHPGEEANDQHFAARLATDSQAQYFVQDGFGVVHRKHASTDTITQYLPSVAGFLLQREYTAITEALEKPQRPLTIVLGGAKVADKIPVIERFIDLADTMVIGGVIANTFLKFYNGNDIGKSIYDKEAADIVAMLMHKAANKWCPEEHEQFEACSNLGMHFLLPTDVAVGTEVSPEAQRRDVGLEQVDENDYILDLGQQSIGHVVNVLESSKTVIWNGPLGYAENPQFAYGSNFVAGTLASRHGDIHSVVGGGDTADFVINWSKRQGIRESDAFDHISTGGGASLDLMAGEKLPGIEALLPAS